jgi:cytochrome c556
MQLSKFSPRTVLLAMATAGVVSLSPLALSHFDDKAVPQSYRQSFFAMVATNFGPMVAMVKGEMPWDQDQMQGYANDLATLTTLDILRGFPEGSDKGQTRAKPEIWQNKADFESKMNDLASAAAALQKAAAGGDKKQIAQQVGATGKACKACHDEYKSKEYLN